MAHNEMISTRLRCVALIAALFAWCFPFFIIHEPALYMLAR